MITHPEKVLFPDDGITKADLAAYYEAIAPVMLPHIVGRPVTLERFHQGIGNKGIYQKNVVKGFPAWLERIEVPKKDGVVHHPLVTDTRSLLWLANQNSITPHVWTSRAPDLYHPDVCVFDLDPSKDDQAMLRFAALALRVLLDEIGLPSWVKTSGSKGFHIVVPLDGTHRFDQVAHFAHGIGVLLVQRDPEHLTQEFIKADRRERILVDTGRNGMGATFAAPYSVRPKPGAPISAPCTWEEVENGSAAPQSFTLRSMRDRLERVGDLWKNLSERGQSLHAPIERLRGLVSDDAWRGGVAALRRKPAPKRARKA